MNVQKVSWVHATRPWGSSVVDDGYQLLCNGRVRRLVSTDYVVVEGPVTCDKCLAILAEEAEALR